MPRRSAQASSNPLVISGIVGDVLDPFNMYVPFTISFNNTAVKNGHEFTPSQIANKPRVEVGGDAFTTFYTLAMMDADAPSPSNPYQREYLHWLVTNISGTTDATYGEEVVNFESLQPSSGIYRMIFVMFRQSGRQTIDAPGWCQNFKTRDFAQIYDLGLPVADVYFNCPREGGHSGMRM